jgi:hypothetical protein
MKHILFPMLPYFASFFDKDLTYFASYATEVCFYEQNTNVYIDTVSYWLPPLFMLVLYNFCIIKLS